MVPTFNVHVLLVTVIELLVVVWLNVTVTSLLALSVCSPILLQEEQNFVASIISKYWMVTVSPASAGPGVPPLANVMPVTVGGTVSLLVVPDAEAVLLLPAASVPDAV